MSSANEVCNGAAKFVSGSVSAFCDLMNERAKALGCTNTHFVNPNGLPNEEHYTSAYDLAMIGRAFFANEALCKMTMTHMLHILPSERQPDDIMEVNKMELIPGGKYAYPYLVGCKTGYTDVARSTLVSCAEKDGMKLICVVMKIRLLCSTMDSVISREQTSLRRRRNIISTMRELFTAATISSEIPNRFCN